MPLPLIRAYIYSAGTLLLAAAAAAFMTNWANAGYGIAHDPIFMLTIRNMFWIVGGIGLAVALICLFGTRIPLQLTLVLWFSINLLIYRFAAAGAFKGSIGNLSDVLGFSPDITDDLLKMMALYLSIGSLFSLLWLWIQKKFTDTDNHLKIACSSCGGRIQFAVEDAGKKISCPHCQTIVSLLENLKMSCFFCREHIGFPAHALGQKIKCPHCNMDITLKEPA